MTNEHAVRSRVTHGSSFNALKEEVRLTYV
ncbi:hypothetical protein BASP5262_04115 [Bacillus spizizenii]|nr:hypothetical protein DJ97_3284 [Bacillus spizizenii]